MQYPLTFPKTLKTERLGLNRRQSATESTWTYKQQTVHTASQWVLEWTWPQMRLSEAEAVSAWLLSLRGQVGTFRYAPRQSRTSTLAGVVLGLPGYAYNNTIQAHGYAANVNTTLRIGQFFQLGDQLLRIVEAPAFADAAGNATITFEPELRLTFAAGTVLNFTNPSGLFRLASSDATTYTLDPDRAPEFGTVAAREVV